MRKLLMIFSISAVLLSHNSLAYAANFDPAAISAFHQNNKEFMYKTCKASHDASGAAAPDNFCKCYSEQLDKAIDDEALSKCANDNSGAACTAQVLANAMDKADASGSPGGACHDLLPASSTGGDATDTMPSPSPTPQN